MKFFSAIVLLAVAVCANASGWGPSLSVSGPWGVHSGTWDGSAWSGAAPWAAAPWGAYGWGAPAAVVAAHAPIIAAHAPIIAAAPTPVASYVAANRGSAHSAPLVGHTVSVKSLNVDPAPGTW